MEFLVNDLSLHGQFWDLTSFKAAITRLMAIRQVARRFNLSVRCHRRIMEGSVTPAMTMRQAIQMLTHDERHALVSWLTQCGPFWEDARNHGPDDWLESSGVIVTDTAVGEAGWCCLNGIVSSLVSITPSAWNVSPVMVDWLTVLEDRKSVAVENYWESATIEPILQAVAPPIASWEDLKASAVARFTRLTFALDAFTPLVGHPFVPSAAQRILVVLNILDRLKSCINPDGQRTAEGHALYQNFFTGRGGNGGRGALFSDSSDEEKSVFRSEMTFRHPADDGRSLFCPMHGKIQTPQLRVHFSWPVHFDEPFYIVYVGPKLTKR